MCIDHSILEGSAGLSGSLRRRTWSSRRRFHMLAATLVLLGLPSAVQASLLTVNLSGVDIRFKGDTSSIVDDDGDLLNAPGNTNPGIADDVDTATFKSNNVILKTWMDPPDDIRADLLIEDGLASLAPNTPTALPLGVGTNEFLWFVDDGTHLRLEFDSLNVQRTALGIPGLPEIFQMTGSATVVGSQMLPGAMKFAGPVGFAYVSTDAGFLVSDTQGFAMSGVLTITGEMVPIPEPASVALGGIGLLAVLLGRRRQD